MTHETPDASARGRRFGAGDASTHNADHLDNVVQAHIGRELRSLFDGIATEPVPDRFLQLLQKLEAQKSGPNGSQTKPQTPKEDRA